MTSNGHPVPDATVSVARAPVSMPDLAMITDADGRFAVDIPAPGRYVFSVFVDGRARELARELTPGRGPAVVQLVLAD